MENRVYVPLRERALRAWRKDRPKRIAQLRRRIAVAISLREELEKVFGDSLPINVITDLHNRPVAIIEELRFTFIDFRGESEKNIALINVCPRCEAEVGFAIGNLAELGQLLESFDTSKNLGCSECIGLSDSELKSEM